MNRSDYIGVVYRDNEHMTQLHQAYYGQFVTEEVTNLVLRTIGHEALMNSTDRSFNDIRLRRWDSMVPLLPASVPAQMRQCGDYLTLAGGVCILKEAARQIKERAKGGDCDDHAIGLGAAIMSMKKKEEKMSDSLTTTTTPISRSEKEILNAYKEASSAMFGFAAEDYLVALPFASAKPYLKDDVTEEDWNRLATRTRESVLERMKEYASFAWSKVTGHRGISAGRNLDHYRAWCWLLGDEESVNLLDAEGGYAPYGAPKLAFVCKKYDLFIPDTEEARRMSEGESCKNGCTDGCNS